MTTGKNAFVTLVTSDNYVVGAKVLAKSLRNVGTKHKTICLATPNISHSLLKELSTIFDEVRQVDPLDSKDVENLSLLGRPELGCTFTKIQVWNQLDLAKIVFMDADMLALKNIDELFEERDEFSAAPDVGWPDCFNSGLFVCKPSLKTYQDLLQMAQSIGSFDGGDQGLLNQYFSDWSRGDASRRLPFGYNLTFSSSYSYLPAFKQFKNTIKVVHFIGTSKPWTFHRLSDGRVCPRGDYTPDHLDFIHQWWNTFDSLQKTGFTRHTTLEYDNSWKFSKCPPCSPTTFGNDQHGFANYKISWAPEIESRFNGLQIKSNSKPLSKSGKFKLPPSSDHRDSD